MIFVTVGNHYQGFDRLLKKMDEITPRLDRKVIIQKGYSSYRPKHAECFDFVTMDVSIGYIQNADLVVSHAGIGTIIICKEHGIPLIIFPRRKKFNEHGTDHQMEIARALEERKEVHIHAVYEEARLEERIKEVLKGQRRFASSGNTGRAKLIDTLRAFVEQ
jgi:UDP-N-acetylglucosamine transferase subunit ALG13